MITKPFKNVYLTRNSQFFFLYLSYDELKFHYKYLGIS